MSHNSTVSKPYMSRNIFVTEKTVTKPIVFKLVQHKKSYSAFPVLPAPFCLSCTVCPILPVLFWLSCYACLSWLSYPCNIYIFQPTSAKGKANFAVPEWTHSSAVLFCDSFVLLLVLSCNAAIVWLLVLLWYCLVMYCLEDVLFWDTFFLCCAVK